MSEPTEAFTDVPIDRVREFWDRRPCNLRHSPRPVGSREYFDEVEQRKYFVEPHIPGFAEFPRWAGKRVLEIGCGLGTDTINFARQGARVTAVDLSEESMALAKKRAQVFGLADRIDFRLGNSEELASFVEPAPYDLIYSFGVIHHTPHPERVIAQLREFTHADTELRVMVYSRVSYKLFWILHEEGIWDMSRVDELVAKSSEAQSGCPVTYTYDFEQARALLAGFDVYAIEKAHIFTWDVEAYKRYEYVKDAAWAGVSDEELARFERELGWHTLIKARPAA